MKEVRRWIKYSYFLWCPVSSISFFQNPVLATVGPRSLNLLFFSDWRQSDRNTSSCPLQGTQTSSLCAHIFTLCVNLSVCVRVGLCVPWFFVTCRTMLFFPKRQPLSLHLSSSPDESRMLKRKGRRGLWETAPQVDEAAGVLLTVCVWPLIEYLVVIPAGTPI